MTISALAIAAAAVWPALDASDAAIYRSIHEPRVVAVQPNHTHKEMVLMPDGEVRYYGKVLVDGRPREVYLSSPTARAWRGTSRQGSRARSSSNAASTARDSSSRSATAGSIPATSCPCASAQDRGQVAVRTLLPASPDACDRPRSEGRLLSLLPQGPSAIAQIGKGSQNQIFKIF